MLKLSEVRAILREYNIRPSKRFGQNFLIDQNIKNKIVESIGVSGKDVVLEIGPGFGALTEDLCKKAKKVIAVEKDKRLYEFLTKNISYNNLELINNDILKYDLSDTVCRRTATHGVGQVPSKLTVVGNLPYSISSPILNHLINNKNYINSAYITVQMEFGERLVASPGTKDYGSLSCYAQFYGNPKILFKIPRGAFFPVPEVDSCFLKIDFNKEMDKSIDHDMLFKIIRSSFEKRRKTILNSLSSSGIFKSKEETLICLTKAGISPNRRPETISLQEFAKLWYNINITLINI
ncbi:MAG: 16S rRNA (adenine(1518)-N(6)/adenine(1519)-N(6))-dimethyltransferase RsmA [Candidatus Omnitrophota bacterium]|nr:16S rRNA (adenine(1518)-N(6)/adenine(1519)-N(6))-dimethyltransferase RsmA [Candidatus Omnitrophota bacterium]